MQADANVVRLEEQLTPLERIKQGLLMTRNKILHAEADAFEALMEHGRWLECARVECGEDDRRFGKWLAENNCNYYNKNDRANLLKVIKDSDAARDIYSENHSLNPQVMWRKMNAQYRANKAEREARKAERQISPTDRTDTKTPADFHTKPPRSAKRGEIMRKMKLGEEIYKSLHNTSLGNSHEMDALIELRRIDETCAEVLTAEAKEGKPVSAVAEIARIKHDKALKAKDLIAMFVRRMNYVWERGDAGAQQELIDYLQLHIKKGTDNG
jgi:hypothetical protein